MLKEDLEKMAKAKTEIKNLWLSIDNAPTITIARIRYSKVKDRLKELITQYRNLLREWVREKSDGKEAF